MFIDGGDPTHDMLAMCWKHITFHGCPTIVGEESDEKLEADAEWVGHSPITRARQFSAVQTALKADSKPFGAAAISSAFDSADVKYANKENKASPFQVTVYLRVLHRFNNSVPGKAHSALEWLEMVEAEVGRKGPFDSIYLLDNFQKALKNDQDLNSVVFRKPTVSQILKLQ